MSGVRSNVGTSIDYIMHVHMDIMISPVAARMSQLCKRRDH